MKVLVIGSGGREHALCWSLKKSPLVERLFCAPGNGGIEDVAECVDIGAENIDEIISFCQKEDVGFVVVGPEGPLVLGLVDKLANAGIKSFGPSAAAAALEGSKGFMKDLCREYEIPTAAYQRFDNANAAKNYVATQTLPIVIKADGLAAGKGVIIAGTLSEANETIDEIFGGLFGGAGAEIVIEEFLEGEEASFFVLTDGEHILPLATAQDHKPVGDGDTGPNTGGMGAYSPAPVMTQAMIDTTIKKIIKPTVKAMKDRGIPFTGVLYAGLMITTDGPKLIEYNVRFGDPECQVLCARIDSDLLPALIATSNKGLADLTLQWRDETALVVVMAADGYPGSYEKNTLIQGLDEAAEIDDVLVYHAGTKRDGDTVLATGGRVLGITGMGKTVKQAQEKAYSGIETINWPQGFCRSDIGWRAVEREEKT
ncbi:phosphoribosylamine--glycine ligase [Sneathiella litorea]|uniref:Phosphoribosylamine--glycine ligase n=1 Tax=Sneathiella litorea TaxID=2606216 RepID=A0A6L8W3I0_9PROT|nr:phosphoribosylamine--glycine ligase [Sneathiella litorea]MZR29249.1 phosphoribosylamine--glycine ligase [Sneathiella litorea]